MTVVEKARGADGCLDFAITDDLLDTGRVNLFERWESQHRRRAALVRKRQSVNCTDAFVSDMSPTSERTSASAMTRTAPR